MLREASARTRAKSSVGATKTRATTSFPPTSGRHYVQPLIFNQYTEPVPEIQLVHNLEHGAVILQYGNKVPSAQVDRITQWYRDDPNAVIVSHTGRTGRMFDLYRLNLTTGQLALFAENPGDVCGWSMSQANRLRMRFRCLPDAGWVAEVPDGVGGWREAIRGAYGDHVRILGYPRNPRYAWALSNRGRNRVALVRIDLRNGHEELLYEHPIADLYGGRVLESGAVSYVWAWPGFQDWRFYDAFLQAEPHDMILAQGDSYSLADFPLSRGSGTVRIAASAPPSADLNLERAEKQMIERALQKHAYNISAAASELGLTRGSLYRRMEKHGL